MVFCCTNLERKWKMLEGNLTNIIIYYHQGLNNPLIWLLSVLVVSDLILGNIMAWTTKIYTSKKGISGFIKHFGILACVFLVLPMINAVLGSNAVTIGITTYLVYLYVISILETLGKLGMNIPPVIADRLTQVVESRLKIEIEDKDKNKVEMSLKATEEVDSEGKHILEMSSENKEDK